MRGANVKRRVTELIKDRFGVDPDYPFAEYGDGAAVFRNPRSKKWFGIIVRDIPLSKLGVDSLERVEVMNLKCDPLLSFAIVDNKRIFKGYLMNKEHWITVLLDGSVPPEELEDLISMSYVLIEQKARRK